MTERKWTEGPWLADGNMVRGPKGNTVADVRYKNGTFDAHLIAAAPDLYEALEDLRKWMGPCGLDSEIDNAMSGADKALAKARGGKQ